MMTGGRCSLAGGWKWLVFACLGLFLIASSRAFELSGFMEGETRYFPETPGHDGQETSSLGLSFALQPEFYHEWTDSGWRLVATPFLRWDASDEERRHADLREFYLQKRFLNELELTLGVRQVFWGVMESVHLVNVINQVDLVENIDEEDRLGQPMIQLAYTSDYGTFELFGLPYFRERTFPGRDGRLRTNPYVDDDHAEYESSAEEWHFDLAARYSFSGGPLDFGVYHFYGTSREPVLEPGGGIGPGGKPSVLRPRYEIIHQTGIDLQLTQDHCLWKLEAFTRSGQGDRFWAVAAGFEYTWYDLADTGIDVGLLGEYVYDGRSEAEAPVFQDDLFAGLRIALNDTQDSQVLLGAMVDREFGSVFFNLEASRRLSDHWKLAAELRTFSNIDEEDPLLALERDSYFQLSLIRYF